MLFNKYPVIKCNYRTCDAKGTCTGFHLEKWTRGGGQNNTYRKFRGAKGLHATVHPSRGVWRHAPRKFLNFRPSEIASGTFSDHLWFSNDMEQRE